MKKNIFMALAFCAGLFSCTDDYTNWGTPQTNGAETAQSTSLKSITAIEGIDLAKVEGDSVKLFNAEVSSTEVTTVAYQVNMVNGDQKLTLNADSQGRVEKEALQTAVVTLFGKAPKLRDINTTVYALFTTNSQTVRQTANTVLHVAPYSTWTQFVYFIGSTDGWTAADQRLCTVGFDGVYTGYVYVADPNGWGNACKFQTVKGSWDNAINAATFTGGMTGVTGTDNIEFPSEGVYYMTMDLNEYKLTAVKVDKMSLIGDFNSWGGDVDMTWNATEMCFEASQSITSGGWKFRQNHDWGTSLGGSLEDLSTSGGNLNVVVPAKVKLYPCRNKNDNMYCTVE